MFIDELVNPARCTCCNKQAKWWTVENNISYYYCDECFTEISDSDKDKEGDSNETNIN